MKVALFFYNENSAGKLVLDHDFPALSGSEKQIAWAESIRTKMADEAIKGLLKAAKVEFGIVLKSDDYSAQLDKINQALDIDVGGKTFADHLASLFSETSASYFIDNNNEPLFRLLQARATK